MSARSVGLAARSAATAPVVSAFVVAVIALVAFVGAATPALLHDARTATVRAALERMSPATRDLTGSTRGVPGVGGGQGASAEALGSDLAPVWGRALDDLDAARAAEPEPLRGVLDDPRIVVVADPAASTDADAARPKNRILLTLDPTYASRIEFVEGSAPTQFGATDELVSYEVALSAASADALDWGIGQTRTLSSSSETPIALTLSGIYEVADADAAEWSHVPTALRPGAVADPDGNITYYASAYAPPAALPLAQRQSDWFAVQTWLPLAVARVDGRTADVLSAQLRAATGVQVPLQVVLENRWPLPLTLTSTAPPTMDAATARADTMAQIVLFVGVGPLALAIVVLALASRLLATRRVGTARLVTARGASTRLLTVVLGAEALVLGLVGAGAGTAIATALWGSEGAATLLVPVLVAATPVVVLPWLTLQLARGGGRRDLGVAPRTARIRRLAVEAAIVVGAGALTVLALAGPPGVDPALLAVPVAVCALASVAALRLVPLVLGALERRAPATRGLVALVGPARGRRDPAVRAAPVLAVVLGLAATLFAVAFAATMAGGIQTASRVEAGADLRLDVPYLGADELAAIRGLDGVSAVAAVSDGARVELRAGDRTVRATAYATDTSALAAVQAASGIETVPIPAGLTAGGAAAPVVVSADLQSALGGASPTLDDLPIDVVAAALPAARIGTTQTWLLVDDAVAAEFAVPVGGSGTTLIALDPGADPEAVTAEVAGIAGPDARITTPSMTADRLSSDPALVAVVVALVAAGAVVVLLLVLAVGMTLVLGSPSRARLLALLAALGYPRRREVPFVWWEVAPALLLALPFGVVVGIVLPLVTIPRLNLSAFLADVLEPQVQLGGWMPVLVVGGFIALTALAVWIAAAAASRFTAASAVRTADEEG